MERNGSIINCKVCGKDIYAWKSLLGKKKYCSRYCGFKDNFGFIPKRRFCKMCGKEFYITKNTEVQRKTCSSECWKSNNYAISAARSSKKTERVCEKCGSKYTCLVFYNGSGLCKSCRNVKSSESRMGVNNPAYRNGFAIKGSRKYTGLHLRACSKYRKAFLKKSGSPFCEICGVGAAGTMRFEVHHIYYASLHPKHPELHNFKNLIHICIQCHNDLHASKMKDVFLRLEKERGLKELFMRATDEDKKKYPLWKPLR